MMNRLENPDQKKKLFPHSLINQKRDNLNNLARFSEINKTNNMNRNTLQLDPPSQRNSDVDINDFEYNKYQNERIEGVPIQKVESKDQISYNLYDFENSVAISFQSEYNSEKNSKNYDSKIQIGAINQDCSFIDEQKMQTQSHFFKKKENSNRRFQSDFYLIKKNQLPKEKLNFTKNNGNENKQKIISFGINEEKEFETNDNEINKKILEFNMEKTDKFKEIV
jgi:hypothetical protein